MFSSPAFDPGVMIPSQHWVVDSIEEGVAAIEVDDGARLIHLPLAALPAGVTERDVLHLMRDRERIVIERDAEAREAALQRSAERTKAHPNPRDPGGR